jgi:hypothetical protein
MKTNPRRFASRTNTSFLVSVMLSLSTAQAAEPVQWTDLPKKIGHGKIRSDNREDRQYRVVTKDGRTYVGYKLFFRPNDVSLSESGPTIPREQVAEIRIHRDGRLSDALYAPAGPIVDDHGVFLTPFGLLLLPVLWGVMAVAAPVVLPLEGVKRLLPDRVFTVAP